MATIPPGITVAGKIEPIEQPVYHRISKVNGVVYQRTWKGVADIVYAKFKAEQSNSTDIEFRSDGAVGTLISTYATSQEGGQIEVPTETLELDFNEVRESIFKNPYYSSINYARQVVLRNKANDVLTSDDGVLNTTGLSDLEIKATRLLVSQEDTFLVFVPSLTYTRTVSRRYPIAFAVETTGLVYTTDQVSTYVGSKALIMSIPTIYNNLGTPDGHSQGWMKRGRFNFVANGNAQLIQTFTFGVYSTSLYSFA